MRARYTPLKIACMSLALFLAFAVFKYAQWRAAATVDFTGRVAALRFVPVGQFSATTRVKGSISAPNATNLECEDILGNVSARIAAARIKTTGWALKEARVVSEKERSTPLPVLAVKPDGPGLMMRAADSKATLSVRLTRFLEASGSTLQATQGDPQRVTCGSLPDLSFQARNVRIETDGSAQPVLESVRVNRVLFFEEDSGKSTLAEALEIRIMPDTSWLAPYAGKQVAVRKGTALQVTAPAQCDSNITDQRCLYLDLDNAENGASIPIRLHGEVSSIEVAGSGSVPFDQLLPGPLEWIFATYATPLGWISVAVTVSGLVGLLRNRNGEGQES